MLSEFVVIYNWEQIVMGLFNPGTCSWFRFVAVMSSVPCDLYNLFTHIFQGCFTDTGAIACPSASEVIMKDMGKIGRIKPHRKHDESRTVGLLQFRGRIVNVVP